MFHFLVAGEIVVQVTQCVLRPSCVITSQAAIKDRWINAKKGLLNKEKKHVISTVGVESAADIEVVRCVVFDSWYACSHTQQWHKSHNSQPTFITTLATTHTQHRRLIERCMKKLDKENTKSWDDDWWAGIERYYDFK